MGLINNEKDENKHSFNFGKIKKTVSAVLMAGMLASPLAAREVKKSPIYNAVTPIEKSVDDISDSEVNYRQINDLFYEMTNSDLLRNDYLCDTYNSAQKVNAKRNDIENEVVDYLVRHEENRSKLHHAYEEYYKKHPDAATAPSGIRGVLTEVGFAGIEDILGSKFNASVEIDDQENETPKVGVTCVYFGKYISVFNEQSKKKKSDNYDYENYYNLSKILEFVYEKVIFENLVENRNFVPNTKKGEREFIGEELYEYVIGNFNKVLPLMNDDVFTNDRYLKNGLLLHSANTYMIRAVLGSCVDKGIDVRQFLNKAKEITAQQKQQKTQTRSITGPEMGM